MEEKPPLVACLILGAVGGLIGAIFGAGIDYPIFAPRLPPRMVVNVLIAAPLIGIGVGLAGSKLQDNNAVRSAFSLTGSAGLCLIAAKVVAFLARA